MNLNNATFEANYDLWIIGSKDDYYLIPTKVLAPLAADPAHYRDRHHPNLVVVSGDTASHKLTYGTGGKKLDLHGFWRARLPS